MSVGVEERERRRREAGGGRWIVTQRGRRLECRSLCAGLEGERAKRRPRKGRRLAPEKGRMAQSVAAWDVRPQQTPEQNRTAGDNTTTAWWRYPRRYTRRGISCRCRRARDEEKKPQSKSIGAGERLHLTTILSCSAYFHLSRLTFPLFLFYFILFALI